MRGLRFQAFSQDLIVLEKCPDIGFMCDRLIENRKKGLVRVVTVAPVGLFARFVPRWHGRVELVVGLCIIGAVISGFPQVFRETLDFRRERRVAAHMLSAQRVGIHARDQAGATGRRDAAHRKGVDVADAFRGETIEVQCGSAGLAEATEMRADVLAGQPQNVRRSVFARITAPRP